MSSQERPTLERVAERAGVSLKTASRAMNGEYGVAEATAFRVREAARELGFRPNQLARSLAAGRSSPVIGLMLPSVADFFMAAVVGAIEEVLSARGLNVMTASHHDEPDLQRDIVRTLIEHRIDGLIMIPAPGDMSYLQAELNHGLSVVSLDRPVEGVEVDTVLVDNAAGAAAAVARLAALGHRRIGALSTDDRLWTLRQRHHGYLSALTDLGVPFAPEIVSLNCGGVDQAESFVTEVLRSDYPPTAFFSAQLESTRGVVRAVRGSGRSIDIAVFDEVFDSDLLVTRPQVMVASGPHRLGHIAASMALEQLDPTSPRRAPRTVHLAPMIFEHDQRYRAPSLAESLSELDAHDLPLIGTTHLSMSSGGL